MEWMGIQRLKVCCTKIDFTGTLVSWDQNKPTDLMVRASLARTGGLAADSLMVHTAVLSHRFVFRDKSLLLADWLLARYTCSPPGSTLRRTPWLQSARCICHSLSSAHWIIESCTSVASHIDLPLKRAPITRRRRLATSQSAGARRDSRSLVPASSRMRELIILYQSVAIFW